MDLEKLNLKVKVNLLSNSTNNVKALASITFDECFAVTGIRIVEGQKGLFTAMPSRKTANGEYKDICFPTTAEARASIQDEILKAYYEKLGDSIPEHNDAWEVPAASNYDDDDLPF